MKSDRRYWNLTWLTLVTRALTLLLLPSSGTLQDPGSHYYHPLESRLGGQQKLVPGFFSQKYLEMCETSPPHFSHEVLIIGPKWKNCERGQKFYIFRILLEDSANTTSDPLKVPPGSERSRGFNTGSFFQYCFEKQAEYNLSLSAAPACEAPQDQFIIKWIVEF